MLRVGERAVAYLLRVLLCGTRDVVGEIGVALDELRRLAGGEPKHVVEHEHLPVRPRPGSDTDRRNAKRLRDPAREIGRHSLEDDAECAGLLELFGIRQDPRRLLIALALDLEAA